MARGVRGQGGRVLMLLPFLTHLLRPLSLAPSLTPPPPLLPL
jgi:hypothetical protein